MAWTTLPEGYPYPNAWGFRWTTTNTDYPVVEVLFIIGSRFYRINGTHSTTQEYQLSRNERASPNGLMAWARPYLTDEQYFAWLLQGAILPGPEMPSSIVRTELSISRMCVECGDFLSIGATSNTSDETCAHCKRRAAFQQTLLSSTSDMEPSENSLEGSIFDVILDD